MSQGVTRGDITVTATGDDGILLTIADGESQVQIECQSKAAEKPKSEVEAALVAAHVRARMLQG